MGFARAMTVLGIIKKAATSNSAGAFALGIHGHYYVFAEEPDNFLLFCETCTQMQEEWDTFFGDMGVSALSFHKQGIDLLVRLGMNADVCGFKRNSYCTGSVVRKIMLAEVAAGRWRSDMHEMTVKDLSAISVDEGNHLSSVTQTMPVEELSYLCFGRTDWGLLVSCFACLWHEFIEMAVKNDKKWGKLWEAEAIVSSMSFAEYVRKKNSQIGTASAPCNLLTGYILDKKAPKGRGLKRRLSDEH